MDTDDDSDGRDAQGDGVYIAAHEPLTVVSSGADGLVRVSHVVQGIGHSSFSLSGHEGDVTGLATVQGSSMILTAAGGDKTVRRKTETHLGMN